MQLVLLLESDAPYYYSIVHRLSLMFAQLLHQFEVLICSCYVTARAVNHDILVRCPLSCKPSLLVFGMVELYIVF